MVASRASSILPSQHVRPPTGPSGYLCYQKSIIQHLTYGININIIIARDNEILSSILGSRYAILRGLFPAQQITALSFIAPLAAYIQFTYFGAFHVNM
jgi:hypothetical protein